MSNDDAKEWVTIKVPETVRMPAKADARTYGEIMSSGLVFDVDERTRERFEELRQDTDTDDAPMMGPGLFLSALLDTWEAAEDGYYDKDGADMADVAEQLDRLESSASTIEERTGRIEQTLEDMGARR